MPGPWIEGKANVNWLREQTFEEGSIFEIRGYDAAKKPQGVILVEVTCGGSPKSHLSRLGIRVLAASDRDLNWWMRYGPGRKLKNIGILHLCSEEVKGCQHFKLNEDEEFHTDGIRLITMDDIIKRSVKWWCEEPGKAMFEDSRIRLLRERRLKDHIEGEDLEQKSGDSESVEDGTRAMGSSEVPPREGEKRKRRKRKSPPAHAAVSENEESSGVAGDPRKEKNVKPVEKEETLSETGQKVETDEARQKSTSSSYESVPVKSRHAKKRMGKKKTRKRESLPEEQKARPNHPELAEATGRGTEASGSKTCGRRREAANDGEETQWQEEKRPVEEESTGRKRSRSRRRGRSPEEKEKLRNEEESIRRKGKPEERPCGPSTEKAATEALEMIVSLDEVGETETEDEGPKLWPRVKMNEAAAVRSSRDWRTCVEEVLKKRVSFADLGRYLVEMVCNLDTALGNFVREYSNPMRPPHHSTEVYQRKGDLLPIHPSCVKVGMKGVTAENIHWVKVTLCCLNFHHCAAWGKPICVPMDDRVAENQRLAIQQLGETISRNIVTAEILPTVGEAKEMLNTKRYDYCGNPVEHMQELDAEKIIATWPKVGAAGVRYITEFLEGELGEAVSDPKAWWLPRDRMPEKRTVSRVRATDETWYKICEAAHARGMMEVVEDSELMKDRNGHYIVNGAGGVLKEKEVNGKKVQLQRFISVLIPTNEHTMQLPGEQDSLPYVGQLTGILLKEEEKLIISSEDFTSAFNLFAVPKSWLPHFAFSKKVDASAFGGRAGVMVRPALSVVPMGWKSAVTLIQAAVRQIVFKRAGIPMMTSVEKGKALPEGDTMTVVYLDNFDELKRLRQVEDEIEEGRATPNHQRFNEVCDELGLDRNRGKQLLSSLTGGLQGGEMDGDMGVLRMAPDKLRRFLVVSLALLGCEKWKEFAMRHWTGKAAFVAAFKRPLFAILQEIFPHIEEGIKGAVVPAKAVIDEVVCMMILAVQGEADLRAQVSEVVTCTDASPTGGGIAIASKFKNTGLVAAQAKENSEECGCCEKSLLDLSKAHRYPCPRKCGKHFCSLDCTIGHKEDRTCSRKDFFAPVFGERFSGPNFPLTKAVALAGTSVQRPLDLKLPRERSWDFFTEQGKILLGQEEMDPELQAEHWAPSYRTFMKPRGRPVFVKGKGKTKGPQVVRSEEAPWGLDMRELSKDERAKVRQDNKMAKRALARLKEADEKERVASLEHPYDSLLWYTEEAKELIDSGRFYFSTYSHCCYGGRREMWTGLLHNSEAVHSMVHKPRCPGHENLEGYETTLEEGEQRFATVEGAEYPWAWCQSYARGLLLELRRRVPAPIGEKPRDHHSFIYAQVKGATRGFQDESLVQRVVHEVYKMTSTMETGQECSHLRWMSRQVGLKGTDVRLLVPVEESDPREVLTPYPAFRWLWRTLAAWKWGSQQHINVLEVSAFLAEMRRRVRDPNGLKQRYLHIVDSLVTYFAVTKGRSSSIRINRLLRRSMAVQISSRTSPLMTWTLSKWNFSDEASRRFEVKNEQAQA